METIETTGLTLNEYCEINEISPSQVWSKIRHGELVSRTVSGRLKIFGQEDIGTISPKVMGATARDKSSLPDLPNVLPIRANTDDEDQDFPSGQVSIYEAEPTSEVALLIDHLSLAKEENKEILRMTRDSIGKITEMSEQLLESKEQIIDAHKQTIQEKNLIVEVQQEKIENLRAKLKEAKLDSASEDFDRQMSEQKNMYEEMIAAKESRIESLTDKQSTLEKEMRKLRQDYEDLEMLARTLAKD
jgi:hypothetical protein